MQKLFSREATIDLRGLPLLDAGLRQLVLFNSEFACVGWSHDFLKRCLDFDMIQPIPQATFLSTGTLGYFPNIL
jgi:hypothetical protein